ncbi:MAG TPA: alpha/beta hydrolase [Methylomirabilota bacterium]|nr:alpha/beta hydrolase [Methylomirabilota bacterium]
MSRMRAEIVPGAPFDHVVFWPPGPASRTLHVYIDGDGTPWVQGRPAHDPTPRNPLMLRLMNLDPNPRVYLGRPCYHGLATRPPCSAAMWTRERYSERVVVSMAAALRQVIGKRGVTRVAWFGYSGGGTLVLLLAPRFAETAAVVTVAGNLDIDAWADLHGYSRLVGSLNPATHSWAFSQVYERHYVGGVDRIVPRTIVDRAGVRPETVTVIPTYDHVCCWETIWPAVVSQVTQALGPER